MNDLHEQALDLQAEVESAAERIGIDKLTAEKARLDEDAAHPSFWNDTQKAQHTVKQQAKLQQRVGPWVDLRQDILDLIELLELNDDTMRLDLSEQLNELVERYAKLKDDLKFAGPYDDHDVIMSIYAGAGGTDAQDWAQMLQRMYVRWAESNGYEVKTVDESPGDEAVTVGNSGPRTGR